MDYLDKIHQITYKSAMEQVSYATPAAIEPHSRAEDREQSALRVRSARGILTSTQIETLAGMADELSGMRIELTAHGDIVLLGVGQHEAARIAATLTQAGLRTDATASAIVSEQPHSEPGLQHVELAVPDGRVTARQLRDLARLARTYADCELRVTPARNLEILNMPRANLSLLLREPVLRELRPA